MADNQLRPPPNVRRELNHLTNVINPVMGQHTVNARMLSHALTLFSPYSKLKCGVGSPVKVTQCPNEASVKPELTGEVIGKQTKC